MIMTGNMDVVLFHELACRLIKEQLVRHEIGAALSIVGVRGLPRLGCYSPSPSPTVSSNCHC